MRMNRESRVSARSEEEELVPCCDLRLAARRSFPSGVELKDDAVDVLSFDVDNVEDERSFSNSNPSRYLLVWFRSL